MAKASPAKLNFNAGEFAITVEGRIDLDRSSASMRVMRNAIAAPQGPCLKRSGTYYRGNAYEHTNISALLPFEFSEEQAQLLEFANERIRFVSEDGFQIYTPGAITAVVTASPFKFTSAALVGDGAAVGQELYLDGFANDANINGVVAKITAVSGSDITVDAAYDGPTGAVVGATGARLYYIISPYASADVRNLVAIQTVDVLYLFCKNYRTRTLSRNGAYDWRLAELEFIDGPFEAEDPDSNVLTPSDRGRATGTHSSYTAASPDTGTVDTTDHSGSNNEWKAFDNDKTTYWESSANQAGILGYIFDTPVAIEGYTIYLARRSTNNEADNPKDWGPYTWTFEGSHDGSTWFVLDERTEYPSYKNMRSQYIKINNKVAYTEYRLNVESVGVTGAFKVRVSAFYMRAIGDVTFNLTADAITRINRGQGFLPTDVGRLIRLYQGDGFWRSVQITAHVSSTVVTVKLQGEPLYDTQPIRRWRFGSVSDTTGWPVTGTFWQDRLVVGGMSEYPTAIALSQSGIYNVFSQTDPDGSVIADNGIYVKLNTRKASPLRWMTGDERGLLLGLGDSEWILKEATANEGFSARNIKASKMTARGSAAIVPAEIDRQVIFTQATRRTVREYAYNFESDGFKSPSMSLFAPHLGVPLFAQLAYAAEPHSIVWYRRDDGSMVGMTYQRDENVVGWHRHDFGGAVESIAVIPSATDLQDTLWMVIRRTIDGNTRRYIESLTRFWDFGMTLADAHFVDSGLRIEGPHDAAIFGLDHLEGENVCGLSDGRPFGIAETITVVDGSITLPFRNEDDGTEEDVGEDYVVIGLPYEMYAETNRIEAGALDGTSQGKTKRTNIVVPFLWQSAYGEVGVHNEDQGEDEFEQIEYDRAGLTDDGEVVLFDGMVSDMKVPPGYGKRGTLIFRSREPLPFNVIGLYPQLTTQDR